MEWIKSIGEILLDIGFTKEFTVQLIVILLIAYIFFIRKLDKLLTPIKFAIIEIQTLFRHTGKTIKYSLTETIGSPLVPTEFGRTIVKESGLEQIIKKERTMFLMNLDKKLKKITSFTAYDIQEKAIELMISYKDKPIINPVKEYAFKKGIEVKIILRVGGLLLRDEYLRKHPEIISKPK